MQDSFPADLAPEEIQGIGKDTTTLVWDFSTCADDRDHGHVKIYLQPEENDRQSDNSSDGASVPLEEAATTPANTTSSFATDDGLKESMLQYQRQLRKTQAAKRAGATLTKSQLEVVYEDESIVAVNKPAGVLCVPGINNNQSVANLLYDHVNQQQAITGPSSTNDFCGDACSMAVHRLDMDTSGLVVFGKTKSAVSALHQVFRRENQNCDSNKKKKRKQVKRDRQKLQPEDTIETENPTNATQQTVEKEYEALVCGHLPVSIQSGLIDLPLQRDVHHPPFMRVSTPHSEAIARQVVDALRERNWTKLTKRNPKPSQTKFRVVAREYLEENTCDKDESGVENRQLASQEGSKQRRLPVTRLAMTPITGRTHQLRVHCAAMGFPIVGDPVYGVYGESAFCAGLYDNRVRIIVEQNVANNQEEESWRASNSLQTDIMKVYPPGEKAMCLHARKLGIPHPSTGEFFLWEVAPKF